MGIFNLKALNEGVNQVTSGTLSEDQDGDSATSGGSSTGVVGAAVGDVSVSETLADDTATGVTAGSGDGPVVVLSGPISDVYARALNMVYAREELMTMLTDDDSLNSLRSGNPDSVDETGTYVYAIDSSDLDSEGAQQALTSMRRAMDLYTTVVLSVEDASKTNDVVDIVVSIAGRFGIQVHTGGAVSLDRHLKKSSKGTPRYYLESNLRSTA